MIDFPLRLAAWEGHVETVALLVKAGANTEARDHEGFTPLYLVAWAVDYKARHRPYFPTYSDLQKSRLVETMKILLDAGANPNVRPRAPLHVVVSGGHTEQLRLLIDAGADVDF